MPAKPEPLFEATDRRHYYYRRRLSRAELLPAIAIGIAAGLAGFYLAKVLTQRTPFLPDEPAPRSDRPQRRGRGG